VALGRWRPLPARNIFGGFRAWPKTLPDFALWKARLTAISECHPTMAASILFGHEKQFS
jgi:hypothetical protein